MNYLDHTFEDTGLSGLGNSNVHKCKKCGIFVFLKDNEIVLSMRNKDNIFKNMIYHTELKISCDEMIIRSIIEL